MNYLFRPWSFWLLVATPILALIGVVAWVASSTTIIITITFTFEPTTRSWVFLALLLALAVVAFAGGMRLQQAGQ